MRIGPVFRDVGLCWIILQLSWWYTRHFFLVYNRFVLMITINRYQLKTNKKNYGCQFSWFSCLCGGVLSSFSFLRVLQVIIIIIICFLLGGLFVFVFCFLFLFFDFVFVVLFFSFFASPGTFPRKFQRRNLSGRIGPPST